MGVIMMWVSLIVAGNHEVTSTCAITFTLARCGHTICYIFKLMPWRAICWITGVLSTLILACNIVYGAYKHAEKWNY